MIEQVDQFAVKKMLAHKNHDAMMNADINVRSKRKERTRIGSPSSSRVHAANAGSENTAIMLQRAIHTPYTVDTSRVPPPAPSALLHTPITPSQPTKTPTRPSHR